MFLDKHHTNMWRGTKQMRTLLFIKQKSLALNWTSQNSTAWVKSRCVT